MENQNTLKIIIVGEGGVGKSSLLNRYVNDIFDPSSSLTKGVGFFNKKIKYNGNGKEYNAVFWDFGGQSQFRFMLPNFLGGAVGIILTFDLTRFNSMMQVDNWMQELNKHVDLPILLVGTKNDLDTCLDQEYLEEHVANLIQNHDKIIGFIKTSAKDNINVRDTFNKLIGHLLDNN